MSLDDQIRAALDSAATSVRQHVEAELRAFSQETMRLATEQRQQAVKAAAEATAAEVRAQAESELVRIRAASQQHAEELNRAAEARIVELRKGLDELRAHAQQQLDAARRIAQEQIEQARAEVEKTRNEAVQSRAEVERVHNEALQARVETERARSEAGRARAEADEARSAAAQAQARTDSVRAEATQAEQGFMARLTAEQFVNEQKTAEVLERAQAESRQSEATRAARLVDAIRSLDDATGLSDVLERLVECAGGEADRAAVLLVKGDRLIGWRLTGFEPGSPTQAVDISVEDAGVAGAVLQTGVAAQWPSESAPPRRGAACSCWRRSRRGAVRGCAAG